MPNEDKELKKYDFNEKNIGDLLKICLACTNEKEAENLLRQYENFITKECRSEEEGKRIARNNIGYIFGYLNENDRTRMYSIFPVNHPVFGEGFGRGEIITPEKAFRKGQEWLDKWIKEETKNKKSKESA